MELILMYSEMGKKDSKPRSELNKYNEMDSCGVILTKIRKLSVLSVRECFI